MSEKERFKKRKTTHKIVWGVLFVISAIITIVLICLAINDKEVVYYEYIKEYSYYTKFIYIIFLILFGTLDICCILFWLGVKFHSYSYQGHEISIYLGLSSVYLLLDDAVVDKHTGSFLGARPLECDLNGEKVNLTVGYFTLNNYTLRVGNRVLH